MWYLTWMHKIAKYNKNAYTCFILYRISIILSYSPSLTPPTCKSESNIKTIVQLFYYYNYITTILHIDKKHIKTVLLYIKNRNIYWPNPLVFNLYSSHCCAKKGEPERNVALKSHSNFTFMPCYLNLEASTILLIINKS